jgi:homogentisate 1,2-dioxygenase
MEKSLPKDSDNSPKERVVTVQAEARQLLFAAFPPRIEDNRKSWFHRVARDLRWTPRRVRALFHCEARVIRVEEMRALQERYDALERREAERKAIDELRAANRVAWGPQPVGGGGHGQDGDGVRPVVDDAPPASPAGSPTQPSD